MPIRMPLSLIILTKGTPLSECWYSVSWKKMTPPMQVLMRSSALKRIWRNCLRFSSVFSTPTWASRLAMLPAVDMWVVLICSVDGGDRKHVSHSECHTDPQTHLQPGCPSLETLCVEQSHAAPSSEPQRVSGTGASSWVTASPNSLQMKTWPHDYSLINSLKMFVKTANSSTHYVSLDLSPCKDAGLKTWHPLTLLSESSWYKNTIFHNEMTLLFLVLMIRIIMER